MAVVLAASLVATSGLTPAQRAKQMLANMNITEKITMVHGASGEYVVRGSGGGGGVNAVKVFKTRCRVHTLFRVLTASDVDVHRR